MKALDTSKARVLVVGDVMLDRYWYGDVSRISPEAPVPVVLVNEKKEDLRLGGAANVAHNCAALGASTTLLSVVGNDDAGRLLEKLLKRNGVQANLHRDGSIRTTEKLRVIGRQQQLLRMDFERSPSREVLASKLTQYRAALPECDVVILSDYGKGGMTHIAQMIQLARRAKKRVRILSARTCFCASFTSSTAATTRRCLPASAAVRCSAFTSFGKHEPPKPTPA